MPDDLRTRIAKTLQRLYGPSLGAALQWDSEPKRIKQMYLDDADAVIGELRLKRTDGPLKGTPVHRYVTDWMPDE